MQTTTIGVGCNHVCYFLFVEGTLSWIVLQSDSHWRCHLELFACFPLVSQNPLLGEDFCPDVFRCIIRNVLVHRFFEIVLIQEMKKVLAYR